MILTDFIEQFIQPNSLIRLVYKIRGGCHEVVLNNWDDVSMEWEILKNKGKYKEYIDCEVIGITSILVGGPYSEAINICIKKPNIMKRRINKINRILSEKNISNNS